MAIKKSETVLHYLHISNQTPLWLQAKFNFNKLNVDEFLKVLYFWFANFPIPNADTNTSKKFGEALLKMTYSHITFSDNDFSFDYFITKL